MGVTARPPPLQEMRNNATTTQEVTPLPSPCCEALGNPTGPKISTQSAHILGSQTSTQEPTVQGTSYSTAVSNSRQMKEMDPNIFHHLLPEKWKLVEMSDH